MAATVKVAYSRSKRGGEQSPLLSRNTPNREGCAIDYLKEFFRSTANLMPELSLNGEI